MTMKVNGNNDDSTPKKYTMEDLGINKDSKEASIFQRIDKEDGKEHGFLTETQLAAYKRELESYSMYDLNMDKQEIK